MQVKIVERGNAGLQFKIGFAQKLLGIYKLIGRSGLIYQVDLQQVHHFIIKIVEREFGNKGKPDPIGHFDLVGLWFFLG